MCRGCASEFKRSYQLLPCVAEYLRKEVRCKTNDPDLGCVCGRGPCYAPNLWIEVAGGGRTGQQRLTVAHAMLDVSIINSKKHIFERKYLYLPVARVFDVLGPKLHFETNPDVGPKDKPLMVSRRLSCSSISCRRSAKPTNRAASAAATALHGYTTQWLLLLLLLLLKKRGYHLLVQACTILVGVCYMHGPHAAAGSNKPEQRY